MDSVVAKKKNKQKTNTQKYLTKWYSLKKKNVRIKSWLDSKKKKISCLKNVSSFFFVV